jgi:heat shock protein HslJ
MGGTEMGCPGGRLEQDDWLIGLLTSGPTWQLDGDGMLLTAGATTVRLVDEEVAVPDATLVDTRWTLETIIDGETASSVPTGVTATLTFDEQGGVVGTGTCNGFGGTYTATAGTLTFVPGPTTLIGCPGGQAEVENAVAATLSGVTTYTIDGDRLTVTVDDTGRGLVYRASG